MNLVYKAQPRKCNLSSQLKLVFYYRSFGAGLHSNLQASRELWTNGV